MSTQVWRRIPVIVEDTAVGTPGQWGGGGWWRGTGTGGGCPLQERVSVQGLEGDLLKTICFCAGRTQRKETFAAFSMIGWIEQLWGRVLRRLFLEIGTSHSGGANSFSPSEPLLWPSSGTELLDNSFTKREGRASSSFPSTVRSNMSDTKSGAEAKSRLVFLGSFPTLTSLFLHGSRLWDVGERVESFGSKAFALFVFQGGNIWELQGTEINNINAKKLKIRYNSQ